MFLPDLTNLDQKALQPMKLRTVTDMLTRYWTYGVFLAPLAPRFGGNWKGIILAATIRTAIVSLSYAILLRAFSSQKTFGWLIVTSAALLYSLWVEFRWSRKNRH
ncbi:hypothetical protein WJ15_08905 [Burkholderia cepacia]|nr:hypothetical protein WJ15_08905 [Burkholderia cepacia]